jgi:hypothetical protein
VRVGDLPAMSVSRLFAHRHWHGIREHRRDAYDTFRLVSGHHVAHPVAWSVVGGQFSVVSEILSNILPRTIVSDFRLFP